MVINRALTATSCAGCRLALVRSFTSISRIPIRVPLIFATSPKCQISTQQIRASSRQAAEDQPWRDEIQDIRQSGAVEEHAKDGLADNEAPTEEKQESAIPWYLQAQPFEPLHQPLSDLQKLPELPEGSPPILQALLQKLFMDLGLDDLKILDLRHLDPPPALGANLLMLISSARSERHLHVSADRLCRWLRSEYRLRPDADGLLGRNELKLKLKRRAKRARLMGSAVDEDGDDGVRTAWVCVDVGEVEAAEGESKNTTPFIGFGRQIDGVRIVVQIMTKEKREEIELEQLWSGILRRGTRSETEENVESSSSQPETSEFTGEQVLSKNPSTGLQGLGQTRRFHTARSFRSAVDSTEFQSSIYRPMPSQRHDAPHDSEELNLSVIQENLMQDIIAENFEKARSDLLRYSQHVAQLQNEGWRPVLLDLLRGYLESLPVESALLHLGESSSDPKSTPFLKCFYNTISTYPSKFEAETRIWLYCYAKELGHPQYGVNTLLMLFNELQEFGVEISQPSFMYLIRAVLHPAKDESTYHGLSTLAAEGASQILQAMYEQGMEILTEDVLVQLQELTASNGRQDPPLGSIYQDTTATCDLSSIPMSPIQRRIHLLMTSLDLPLFTDQSRMRLLQLYAKQQNWLEFFEIFRMAPLRGQPQSAIIYAFMFSLVADTRHQRACIIALRTWVPEMKKERPPVALEGDVAHAIRACLRVIDPYIERQAIEVPETNSEWMHLWQETVVPEDH